MFLTLSGPAIMGEGTGGGQNNAKRGGKIK